MDADLDAARTMLLSLGVGAAVIDATAPDGWARLVVEQMLWGSRPEYRAADVAERVGMDAVTVRRWWMRLGFPDPGDNVVFRDADVELFRTGAAADALFGDAAAEQFSMVVGVSARRITEAASALFGDRLDQSLMPLTEQLELQTAAMSLFRSIPEQVIPTVLLHAFAATVDFNTLVQAEGEGRVCVGFCDLSGSTALLNSAASIRAMEALAEFEVAANDLAVRHGGHVVKFVGDEVMYTVAAADDAIAVGRALLEWVSDHATLGSARVGIAIGAVTQRDGDLFGPTVNRAARLTAVAASDTMLVDAALTSEGTAGTAGTVDLRGFAEPVAVRALYFDPGDGHG